jgi:hypothetical protein
MTDVTLLLKFVSKKIRRVGTPVELRTSEYDPQQTPLNETR